jgi:hypothetical protein
MIPLPTWTQLTAFLRQAAGIAGLVVSIGNMDHLPANVRSVLLAVSGTLLAVEHYTAAQVPTAPVAPTTPTLNITTTAVKATPDPKAVVG